MQIRFLFAILGVLLVCACLETGSDFLFFKEKTLVTEDSLVVHNCELREWDFLATLPAVSHISLYRTNCSNEDLQDISDLGNLQELSISYCPDITDLKLFASSELLTHVAIGGASFTELSVLTQYNALEELSLHGVGARDLSSLKGLQRIKRFNSIHSGYAKLFSIEELGMLEEYSLVFDSTVKSIALYENSTLKRVVLSACAAEVINLSDLPALDSFQLSSTPKSINMNRLISLESFYVIDNKNLKELRLEFLPELRALSFGAVPELKSTNFSGLSKLRRLCFMSDAFPNWGALCGPSVDTLIVNAHVTVESASEVQKLTNLRFLFCRYLKTGSFVHYLPATPRLDYLVLQNSQFVDFDFLKNMHCVKTVDFTNSLGLSKLSSSQLSTTIRRLVLDSTDVLSLKEITRTLHRGCSISVKGCSVPEDEISSLRELGFTIYE